MPSSRQMASRFGPIHWGQSSARSEAASERKREAARAARVGVFMGSFREMGRRIERAAHGVSGLAPRGTRPLTPCAARASLLLLPVERELRLARRHVVQLADERLDVFGLEVPRQIL